MKPDFNTEIYVSIENLGDGENEYRQVNDTPEDAAETGETKYVGHYVLKNVLSVKSEVKTEVTESK